MTAKQPKAFRRLTYINVQRTAENKLVLSLEASFSQTEPPQRFQFAVDPEQAIELGMALQETGRKVLRQSRGGG